MAGHFPEVDGAETESVRRMYMLALRASISEIYASLYLCRVFSRVAEQAIGSYIRRPPDTFELRTIYTTIEEPLPWKSWRFGR